MKKKVINEKKYTVFKGQMQRKKQMANIQNNIY